MTNIARFESWKVAPENRLTYWNDICSDALDGTSVDSPVEGFRAEMWQLTLGAMKLLRPRSDASVVRRQPGLEDGVLMHLQLKGKARFRTANRQPRRAVDMQAGDFILSTAEAGYTFELSHDHELIVVELPPEALAGRLPALEDQFCHAFSSATPGGRVFRDFLLSLWRQGEDEATAPSDPTYGDSLTEAFSTLCALAVAGGRDRAPPTDRRSVAALRARCDAYIDAHLDDPELGTQALARAFGVSPRTVQGLFAAVGVTPTGYIQHRRLQRAADRLRAEPALSVTEIAFGHGFNDSAYFTRLFRREFGRSPSAWRGES